MENTNAREGIGHLILDLGAIAVLIFGLAWAMYKRPADRLMPRS